MQEIIETLKSFNNRIDRLERSGFSNRFTDKTPEVLIKFKSIEFENLGNGKFTLSGEMESWVKDYNEDEIDAVVLTYRMLTQNNDRISLNALSKIYNSEWFPEKGTKEFNKAKSKVNNYLNSPATVCFEKGFISIRSIMDIIIYGGLAHSNIKKERIFNSWINSGASGMFKVEFITALKSMLYYFSYFKELNQATIQMLESHIKNQNNSIA